MKHDSTLRGDTGTEGQTDFKVEILIYVHTEVFIKVIFNFKCC